MAQRLRAGRVNRRQFVTGGAVTAATLGWASPSAQTSDPRDHDVAAGAVKLTGDGVSLTPIEYGRLLSRLVEERSLVPDSYSIGGVVEELEVAFARLLGKERAVFMPTGTLANQLAVRALAGTPSRVVLQEQSHLYQDCGDCVQTLSSMSVMPVAPGRATFTAEDLQSVLDSSASGRVVSRVSVVAVETPVRRKYGEMFDPAELRRVVALARERDVRLHLDGARITLQAAFTGTSPADYAKPFDTVYVSLYKYYNAASGAILAGPRALLDEMYHVRRMYGGGLAEVWPFALVALHYLNGFEARYLTAVRVAQEWAGRLQQHGAFTFTPFPNGTNLQTLSVSGIDPLVLRERLRRKGILLGAPQRAGGFLIAVNETLNRITASDLTSAFVDSLKG